jgi:transcription elongation GreA/GreB family factor
MLLGILKMIMKPTVKKALNKLADDPEYMAALKEQKEAGERIKKLSKRLKDHPNPSFRKLYEKLK